MLRHREFILARDQTASLTGSDLVNDGYTGVIVFLYVNSASADNVTVTVQGKATVGDAYYDILASAAVSAPGLTVLHIHPAIAPVANESEDLPLPPTWRINAAVGGGGSIDYDVGYAYIP